MVGSWKWLALIIAAVTVLGSGLSFSLRQRSPHTPQAPPMQRDSALPFSKGTNVVAMSDLVAWAIQPERDGSKILFTETQGLRWMDRTPNLGSEAVVRYPNSPAVAFIDQFRAYVALAVQQTTAEGTIEYQTLLLETKDSGETWTRRSLNTGGSYDVPINLFFQDDSRGWLTTESNANGGDSPETKRVFRTFDGGQTWTMVAKLTQ